MSGAEVKIKLPSVQKTGGSFLIQCFLRVNCLTKLIFAVRCGRRMEFYIFSGVVILKRVRMFDMTVFTARHRESLACMRGSLSLFTRHAL